jgi:heme exporter protein A
VLANLSFELSPGEVLELRGANGSGKTSLLRVLAGLAPLSRGKLLWDEHAIKPGDFDHAARMAYLGHLNGLSADLSAGENLRFAQQLGGGANASAALQAWGLASLSEQTVRLLSQGQRRRLALARIWLAQRRLWLLDEPCAALDNAGEQLFDDQLNRHLEAGGMAVVATHRALNIPATALQHVDLDSLRSSSEVAIAAC